ncbi:MAG: septal ring lytic transglycosylase RlpA family protein [Bacteroidota bacterium]|nr:septal ring lytic transglycosylase RlpA family protein [Bacteroidota bacterium]
MPKNITFINLFVIAILFGGCVASPRFTSERFSSATSETYSMIEEGIASYYADEYNGRQTSNGEIYDMYQMTAAHQTLPFNSRVRVTNLNNGKTVEVRINDRGPFKDNRIIDLSLAAARSLEMIGPGTVKVRIEVIELGSSSKKNPK